MEKTGNAEMIGKDRPATRGMLVAAIAIAVVVALQVIYATTADLRTDEAYYWTLSKEYVLSYLDHPPMVAWMVRFGTAIFGDTNFGARFGGLLAIWVAVAILGDIVWRLTRDRVAVVLALLMPFAAPEYGLFASRIVPDAGLILFSLAMAWSLVRLFETGDGRWWLAAGLFGGLSLLSKYTAVFLVPGVLAFLLVPSWRRRWLRSLSMGRGCHRACGVFAGADLELAKRLGVIQIPVHPRWCGSRYFGAYGRRFSWIAVRAGGTGPVSRGAGRRGHAGMARLSSIERGVHSDFDLRAGAVCLFPLEVVVAADRRYLAAADLAVRLCRGRDQSGRSQKAATTWLDFSHG
jgi:hypothetical protein